MNAPEPITMNSQCLPDVQSSADGRNLPIQRVGIKGLTFPVTILSESGRVQPSVAEIDMFVALTAEVKGTHMSRFIEVLQEHQAPLSITSLQQLMTNMLSRLEAQEGMIEFRLPYFINKQAPISGAESLMNYALTLRAEQSAAQGCSNKTRMTQKVVVPVTSLCPCSKKVSSYGAHNQRSHITISAVINAPLAVEKLISAAEKSASSELYGILKRADEKFVTELAYDNPKFVEDLVRDVALAVQALPEVIEAYIEAENFEAIHNHSAYAAIQFVKETLHNSAAGVLVVSAV